MRRFHGPSTAYISNTLVEEIWQTFEPYLNMEHTYVTSGNQEHAGGVLQSYVWQLNIQVYYLSFKLMKYNFPHELKNLCSNTSQDSLTLWFVDC